MKVKVITKFKDKYTNKWHIVDDVFTVTDERYNEIKKFVKVIEKVNNNIEKSTKIDKAGSKNK